MAPRSTPAPASSFAPPEPGTAIPTAPVAAAAPSGGLSKRAITLICVAVAAVILLPIICIAAISVLGSSAEVKFEQVGSTIGEGWIQ